MILQKWNQKKHIYEPFDSPAKKTVLLSKDMEKLVDCAECGKEIQFGEGYTSRLIHQENGFGYPVCQDCSKEEIKIY